VGAAAVTLSTEAFTAASDPMGLARDRESIDREIQKLSDCARLGSKLDLQVSASHGLTLRKARPLLAIQGLTRLDVGHALVASAVMIGFGGAVREWIDLLQDGQAAN
jgi:pyridoxine 5-phosphate synthase